MLKSLNDFSISLDIENSFSLIIDVLIKQNFVTTFKGTVIAFVDGSSIQIPVQSDELFETLLKLNPNIIIGYTPENIKAFNQLVKEHKEQQKGAIR